MWKEVYEILVTDGRNLSLATNEFVGQEAYITRKRQEGR
jgi:hypothetical protein